MLKFLLYTAAFTCVYAAVEQAVVVINTGDIAGRVNFTKTTAGIKIAGTITGLPTGNHGFHIHEKGILDTGCVAAGGHFNPTKKNHGAPSDADRHVGDLGNIKADDSKTATIDIVDSIIALEGDNSIIGRAVVIHAGEDDLGKGGFDDSKTTGHAGARLACGVVGIAESTPSAAVTTLGSYLLSSISIYLVFYNLSY